MDLNQNQIDELESITRRVLTRLYQEDINLISRKGLEQSIAFRFGLYFSSLIRDTPWLSEFSLDMEYNKNGNQPKYIPSRRRGVRPDFILHKRGNNDGNVLIIEFKGWWDRRHRVDDRNKILDFTNPAGQYAYGLGILVEFNKNDFLIELLNRNSTLFS